MAHAGIPARCVRQREGLHRPRQRSHGVLWQWPCTRRMSGRTFWSWGQASGLAGVPFNDSRSWTSKGVPASCTWNFDEVTANGGWVTRGSPHPRIGNRILDHVWRSARHFVENFASSRPASPATGRRTVRCNGKRHSSRTARSPMWKYLFRRLGASVALLRCGDDPLFLHPPLAGGPGSSSILRRRRCPAHLPTRSPWCGPSSGLDKPLWLQYLRGCSGSAKGDLGRSLVDDRPGGARSGQPASRTLQLVIPATLLSTAWAFLSECSPLAGAGGRGSHRVVHRPHGLLHAGLRRRHAPGGAFLHHSGLAPAHRVRSLRGGSCRVLRHLILARAGVVGGPHGHHHADDRAQLPGAERA